MTSIMPFAILSLELEDIEANLRGNMSIKGSRMAVQSNLIHFASHPFDKLSAICS